MAETGQEPAQAPQLMQELSSITYLPLSPSEMAETGHPPAQVPQPRHSSALIL